MVVYLITNLLNGKYYIGQTARSVEKRWRTHVAASKHAAQRVPLLYRAMRKYGVASFTYSVLTTACSQDQLNELEMLWIAALDARNPEVGYNIHVGGEGGYTGKHTSETIDKIKQRIAERAWAPTEEWIAAQRNRTGDKNPMFGRKMSEVGLTKMRAGWARRRTLGLKMNLTEEQRELRRTQAASMRARKAKQKAEAANG